MTNKLEIGRELASVPRELLANFIEYSVSVAGHCSEWLREKEELRALLAAPVVERQGLAGFVIPGEMPVDSGYTLTLNPVAEGKYTKPLYAEQPAPVAVVLPDLTELREYHAKAISNLKSYADDEGLRDSDVKHYTKRADFHAAMVVLIDKVKELNQ